ncbi:MAG: hypothetical protein R3F56_25740 [Planctomycetota bacterium]
MNEPAADLLLTRISRRRAWRTLLNGSGTAALGLAALYAVAVAVARWQVGPTWLERPLVWLALAAVAILVGLRRAGFGDRVAAARALDAHAGCDDLFLTHVAVAGHDSRAALLPVVDASVQAHAHTVAASEVPGPSLQPAVRGWLGAAGLVALALWLSPLAKGTPLAPARPPSTTRAEARIEALRKREVQAPHSPPVEAARMELAKVVAKMQPERKTEVRAELRTVEKKLADLWQQAKRNDPGARGSGDSRLGSDDAAKRKQWQDDLKAGKVDGLKKQLEEVAKEGKAALEKGDPKASERARSTARAIKSFARAQGAKDLDAAMSEMLEALGSQDASAEALAKLGERAELELDALRQAAQDLQALAQALRTQQLAEALDGMDADVGEFDPDAALEDYEKAMGERLDEMLEDLPACEDCEGGG